MLKKLLVAICTDSASVMTGTSSGVATQFIDWYGDKVEAFHCLAHSIELAVHDALKSVTATHHFQSFLKSLYALYSQSPKNQRELGKVAADTELLLLRITASFDIRWVACSFTAIRAVWRNFPALHGHLQNASRDSTRSSTERAKVEGLEKKLGTVSFLRDLALMKDVLRELSYLSLKLQSRTCNIVTSYAEVDSTIAVLKAMKTAGGEKSTKTVLAASEVQQTDLKECCSLVLDQASMLDSSWQPSLMNWAEGQWQVKSAWRSTEAVQKQLAFSWQWQTDFVWRRVSYTVSKTIWLGSKTCSRVEAFRKYKTQKGKPQSELSKVLAAAETFPGSTAECERGFSAMNNTVRDKRSPMNVNTVSSLMSIKLNGVSVANFDPNPYVRSWIAAENRQSTSWITGPKAETRPSSESSWEVLYTIQSK